MIENRVYLISNHAYNLRHELNENPVIIDVIWVTESAPKYSMNAQPKLCYKVKYKDGYVNLIPVSEVNAGYWLLGVLQ